MFDVINEHYCNHTLIYHRTVNASLHQLPISSHSSCAIPLLIWTLFENENNVDPDQLASEEAS